MIYEFSEEELTDLAWAVLERKMNKEHLSDEHLQRLEALHSKLIECIEIDRAVTRFRTTDEFLAACTPEERAIATPIIKKAVARKIRPLRRQGQPTVKITVI